MTTNKLTDEQLQEIYGEAVSCELAEKNGAYMASFDLLCKMDDVGGTAHVVRKLIDMLRAERVELQERRKADSEREQVRSAHAEWSQATFGDVGPVGPLKHLSKEAMEAASEPNDHSEWADMQFLLWDAQRRAGISDEQITQAMVEKLAVNKQREWPEPKDGEPRLHIKEQSVLVTPDGWQLVPKEPTDEMNKAGWAAMNKYDAINPTYRAMLAAAPQQEVN